MTEPIQEYINLLINYWDTKTYERVPKNIKDNKLFIKAINYLKLKHGSMNNPILLDDDYYITIDIKGDRTKILSSKTGLDSTELFYTSPLIVYRGLSFEEMHKARDRFTK